MNFIKNTYEDEIDEIIRSRERKDVSEFKEYLDLPLHNFFINSSHNSYIHSTQHLGFSSSSSIKKCLDMGVRCLEIDIHERDDEIFVAHGNNKIISTSKESIEKCFKEIYYYPTTDPIIICLEIYIKSDFLKRKFINIVNNIFKNRLLDSFLKKNNPVNIFIDDIPLGFFINKIILLTSQSNGIEEIIDKSKISNFNTLHNYNGSHNRLLRIYAYPTIWAVLSYNFNPEQYFKKKYNIITMNFSVSDKYLLEYIKKFKKCSYLPITN